MSAKLTLSDYQDRYWELVEGLRHRRLRRCLRVGAAGL